MYLMTCTRSDLAYPLSLLARYVAPATQRSSQGYTFSLGSGSVSWRSTRLSSVFSSSCEAEIYAGAMAAQELRWLTYLLTDLGEQPRSSPVLYVDNKTMIALCQEHRLEHRTKHIALRYFLARELQQRGQLRLAYVATRANTADIFTKALPPACFAFLDWTCDHLTSRAISAPLPPLLCCSSPALSSTSYPASDETAAVSTTSGRPRSKGGKRRRKGGGAGGGLGGGAGTGVSSASGGGDTGGGTGLAAPTRGVAGVAAWYTAQLRQQSHQK
ncbi:unnamed protein product [Closterium sp. NIES-53]